jgi:hypothetical protein
MRAEQLIGKLALRKKPMDFGNGGSRSFMDRPIRIMAVTDSHIVFEWQEKIFEGQKSVLAYEYLDNNWEDYEALMNLATDAHIKMMQDLQS